MTEAAATQAARSGRVRARPGTLQQEEGGRGYNR